MTSNTTISSCTGLPLSVVGALGGRLGERGQSTETLSQALSDFGVFFGLEWLTLIVMEGQKDLDQMHRGPLPSEPQHSEHKE